MKIHTLDILSNLKPNLVLKPVKRPAVKIVIDSHPELFPNEDDREFEDREDGSFNYHSNIGSQSIDILKYELRASKVEATEDIIIRRRIEPVIIKQEVHDTSFGFDDYLREESDDDSDDIDMDVEQFIDDVSGVITIID